MEIKELRRILGRLRGLYASAGAKGQADDVSKIAEALDGHEHMAVDTFVVETKARLAKLHPPTPDKVDEGVVASCTRRLLAARTNRPEFDAVFAELKAD